MHNRAKKTFFQTPRAHKPKAQWANEAHAQWAPQIF